MEFVRGSIVPRPTPVCDHNYDGYGGGHRDDVINLRSSGRIPIHRLESHRRCVAGIVRGPEGLIYPSRRVLDGRKPSSLEKTNSTMPSDRSTVNMPSSERNHYLT